MLNFTLSALNASDGILVGFLMLFLLVGLKRGLTRSIRGMFFNITLLVAALFFSGACTNPIMDSPSGAEFLSSITKWIESWGTAFSSRVTFSDGQPLFFDHANNTYIELSQIAGGKFILAFVLKFLIAKLIPPEGGMSVAEVLAPNLSSIFMAIILFVVFIIVLILLFKVVANLWDKAEDSFKAFKHLDRILGMIFSVGFAFLFVLFVFAIIGITANTPVMAKAAEHLLSSSLCGPLFRANPILGLFINMFGTVG